VISIRLIFKLFHTKNTYFLIRIIKTLGKKW